MGKSVVLLIMIFVFSILFSQCRKKGELLGTFSFTQEDLAIIPYNGGETIILIDSIGDTIKLVVQYPRVADYEKQFQKNDPNFDPDHIKMVDYYNTSINKISAYGGFDIYLRYSTPFLPPVKKYLVFCSIAINSHLELGLFKGYCGFDNNTLFQVDLDHNLGEMYEENLQTIYFDTLKIYNKSYCNSYGLSVIYPITDTTDGIKTVFYSITHGIIGIKTKHNRVWCIN